MTTAKAPAAGSAGAPAGSSTAWYALSVDEATKKLGVDPAQGLSADEAATRLKQNGPNALPTEKPTPGIVRFLKEYTSLLQIILVVAGAVSLVIGQWATGVLLLALTVLNAIVGLIEEGKAASAMNALQQMSVAKVRVRRGGSVVEVDPSTLVTGDAVLLAAGDRVPADGRLVSTDSLQVDESALTGESTPSAKQTDPPPTPSGGAAVATGDQHDMVFENTDVTHGDGVFVVTATGAATEVGKVAQMLKSTGSTKTPLDRQLNTMTIWIAVAAGLTMVVMFVVGLLRGEEFDSLFVTAVALAIAAIPEALPTVVTVILSLGAVALAARHAVVKDLSSVETLGEVSAINSDKTGTLTMNQMTAVTLVEGEDVFTISGEGYALDGKVLRQAGKDSKVDPLLLPFLVASDAQLKDGKVVGDPLEGALLVLAHKAGVDADSTRTQHARAATLPFDPTYKLMAAFCQEKKDDGSAVVRCYVKGAPEALVSRSSSRGLGAGQTGAMDDAGKDAVEKQVSDLEAKGLRVLAAGTRDIDPSAFDPSGNLLDLVQDLTLGALVGLIDPPRPSSKDAVQKAQAAHIQVRMVTGDDVTTGAAVAEQLGIPGKAITGAELSAMSDQQALDQIEGIGVIGRVAPADKRRLVEIMQKKGYVVAATGDGVNDAPALKAADIGVAMGTGTDVAKNSGRMILQDDDFATIIYAVEQGRSLYDNLNKYIRFILITLVTFVATFLFATVLNIAAGQPFSAAQILWINFFIDTPLGVALGFDKETPGLMSRRPLKRGANILDRSMITTVGLVGLAMTVALLSLISYGQASTDSVVVATTMGLTAFSFMRIVGSWESRSVKDSAFSLTTFDNKQLNLFVGLVLVLMILVTEVGFLQRIIGTHHLTIEQWGLCLGAGVALLLLWELGKLIARRRTPSEGASVPAASPSPAPPAAAQDGSRATTAAA
ncbi:MAG: cation-transporting P-type ATPase [Candidatus Nanopelagicales bacterium]